MVRPLTAAHAQKLYTARRKAWPRDMRMLDACFPDLYTGGYTPGDVSESEAESGCVLHAL